MTPHAELTPRQLAVELKALQRFMHNWTDTKWRGEAVHRLITEKGFTEKGAAACIDNFIESMRFAGLSS